MVWSRKGTHWLKGGRITEGKEKLVNPSNLCLGCSSSTKSHDLPLHLIWVLVHGLLPSDCPPHLTSPSFDHTPSPYSALFFFKSVHKCLKHGLISTVCICFLRSLSIYERPSFCTWSLSSTAEQGFWAYITKERNVAQFGNAVLWSWRKS